ncbi:hypothetical protein J2127_000579 [Methanococcus voltae]|nr:hypothetical protein [Methanococcus voltae]
MTMSIYLQYHLKQNEKIIFIKNLDKIGYILYTNLKIILFLHKFYIILRNIGRYTIILICPTRILKKLT